MKENTYKKSINNLFGYTKKEEETNKVVCDYCYSKLWNINIQHFVLS